VNAGVTGAAAAPASRYQQLTAMIDELGKDIRQFNSYYHIVVIIFIITRKNPF